MNYMEIWNEADRRLRISLWLWWKVGSKGS